MTIRLTTAIFLVTLLLSNATSLALGEMLVFSASKDNTLYETNDGSLSNGGGDFLFAGRVAELGGGALRRALIGFDLSSIEAGTMVNSATLTLQMNMTLPGARTMDLHRVTADWGEGGSDAFGQEGMGTQSQTGDATWIHTFYNSQTWGTEGGDFSAASSASLSVGDAGSYTWGSTSEMVADVQGWIDDSSDNFGWILIGDESVQGTAKRFASLKNVSAGPQLTLDVTAPTAIPEPSTLALSICGLALAGVTFCRRSSSTARRRS